MCIRDSLFDCDGTLADTMPAHYRGWLTVTEPHGLPFDEDRFYSMGGRPTREIIATLAAEKGLDLDVDQAARRAGMQWVDVRGFHVPARVTRPPENHA